MLTARNLRAPILRLLDSPGARRQHASTPEGGRAGDGDARTDGEAARESELDSALERLVDAAERACEALGWLGWEARHAAERELRAALEAVKRIRR